MKRIPLETVTDCTDCGACCMEMRTPPHIVQLKDGEFKPYPGDRIGDYSRLMAAPEEARRIFIDGLFSDRPNDSPCSWFDQETKKCRWYKFRPDVCRNSLQVGDSGCIGWRRKFGITPVQKFRMVNGKMVSA
jgi:Fe-S-cluster containining protein